LVAGILTNPTGPASALIDWKLTVTLPDSRVIEGQIPMPTGKDARIPITKGKLAGQQIELRWSQYGPEVTEHPIPAGGTSGGIWFWADLNANESELSDEKSKVIIEFSDVVSGKKHYLTVNWQAQSKLLSQ